nr:fibronectin type III domain-containing protein [Verrucomicrobiota bacterium JB025]
FSPAGEMLQDVDWNYYSRAWQWDPVKRRMYFFRDSQSPNDLHYETLDADGTITGKGETPYHGDFTVTPPIRVSPDGSMVVIGSGVVFETDGLTQTANLSNGFTDGVWSGEKLVTLREINGLTQLQIWEGDQFLQSTTVRQFNGTPVRIFNTSEGLLLVTSIEDTPRFILLDSAFDPVFISPTQPVAPADLATTGRTVDSVSLKWTDISDNEDSFRIDHRIGTGEWITAATTGPDATTATITGLTANTTYEFRVVAINGALESSPSSSISSRTLSSINEPVGEPYNLAVTRIYRNSITVEWQDNADNETGFRILRSTSANGSTTAFTAGAGSTSFTNTGLSAGTTYYYRVQAVNGTTSGDLSGQVNATTRYSDSSPYLSYSVTATVLSPTTVTVSWTDGSTNEDGFKIERTIYGAAAWTTLASVPYNTESFTDTTAVPDTKYTYRVAAFNSVGNSSYRSATVTTPALGGEFTGFSMLAEDVYYFAFSGPDRIERYDLASRSWLPSIALDATATALWVDESAVFVAEDRAVIRFSLDGATRSPMANADSTVTSIFTLNNILAFAPSGGDFTTMEKSTGVFLANFSYWYSGTGFSVAPSLNRAFFRSTGVSPSDIHFLEFDADGTYLSGDDSPYHGDYPSASRTFVFPNGARVADTSGTVYSTDSLNYTNSLAGAFTDLAFYGTDIPIVLRADQLVSYSNTLLEAGTFTLSAAGLRVAVSGEDALAFIEDGTDSRGLRVETVPLSELGAPEPGAAIDPLGLPFSIDDAFVDKDGNLLLFSREQLSLFRWSPAQRTYTGSFPLIGVPDYAAYSSENHSAYFAYASQLVRAMDLTAEAPVETPLVALPGAPSGLATAGEFIVASDPSGAWNTHYVFSPAGEMLQDVDWNYYSRAWQWDPVKRRMYFFRDS